MVSWIISRLVVLLFGTLYPAYSSYKAVKTKNVKEYVKWMMYWIVFAFFTTAETLTDIILSWFPFYFELKIAFVIWLLSPYTKGSSVLYRKFVHPTLSSKEKEIDEYIAQARDKSYETMMRVGKRGLNIAANAAVTAATKGQGVLSEKLRSFSMQDLTLIQDDEAVHLQSPEPRLRSASSGLVETVVDQGKNLTASPTILAAEEQRQGKPEVDQSDVKSEPSDEDAVEKAPKRTASVKSVKKVTKVEQPQAKNLKARPKKKTTGTTVPGESA
ncbi:receptor expression-enhancing protein 2 isoform X3 [Dendropsophus ebraccatus]|uniref:receptor expression-enhancing protein 2 isoform X3 n=1 Tax=Dendropsophus ebraccatus TaxID=150705 RepID=UPI003832019D